MTRTFLMSLVAVAAVSACGHRDAPQEAADSAIAASTPPLPKIPKVTAFDLAHRLDSLGRVTGGTSTTFAPTDTLFLSIRTQYAEPGETVSARLLLGKKTVDSLDTTTGKADSLGFSTMGLHFVRQGAWPTGAYQVEVMYKGMSQGLKDFTVVKP